MIRIFLLPYAPTLRFTFQLKARLQLIKWRRGRSDRLISACRVLAAMDVPPQRGPTANKDPTATHLRPFGKFRATAGLRCASTSGAATQASKPYGADGSIAEENGRCKGILVLYLRPSFVPMNWDYGGSPLRSDGGNNALAGPGAPGPVAPGARPGKTGRGTQAWRRLGL